MNYKKISKFVKDARRLTIWNTGSIQYISDGAAVYPVYGMPRMSEMEMLNFLGLADKSDKISVVMKDAPEWIAATTYDKCDENVLEKTGPMIILHGDMFRTFYTESGAVVVENSYITAVENSFSKDYPVIHCLTEVGETPAVAVFAGFDLYAIILPIKTEGLYNDYLKLATQLQAADLTQVTRKMGERDESEE